MKIKKTIFLLSVFTFLFISQKSASAQELKIGDPAPDFTSKDEFGQPINLNQFKGKTLVLYFYPRDNTPGCTAEAQSFRDHYDEFQKRHIAVLGVSFNSGKMHQDFKAEHQLPFPLLAENQKQIAEAYGVGGILFANRDTIVIGPDQKILKIFRSVEAKDHAEFILQNL